MTSLRLVFIDDSEQARPPRQGLGSLLAVGAVLVPAEKVSAYASDLAAIRSTCGIPAGEEIKWKPPKGSFQASAGGPLVTKLRTMMLEAAIASDIRSAVVVLDHGAAYKNESKGEAGKHILAWLYERVSMCLTDVSDVGIVIADKPGGGAAEERQWLADSLRLTEYGTEYVEPGRVVLPVVTAPSYHVPHLQLADLVVAATTAAVAGIPAGVALAPLLLKLAHKHSLGYAGGAGIVIFPQRLNLYFWAFGETGWARPSQMAGWSLPVPHMEYGTDDGLGNSMPSPSAQGPPNAGGS